MSAREIAARVSRLLGKQVVDWRAPSGGYTPAERYVLTFVDNTTVFAKAAVDQRTSDWLRQEHVVYSQLHASFMPTMLAWDGDGDRPLLVLEDLSGGYWPPPWRPGDIGRVIATLAEVRDAPIPGGVGTLVRDQLEGWPRVQADPGPFLTLGLVSQRWLDSTLPTLIQAERDAPLDGDELVHLDMRSDNICLFEDRVCFVDWNQACRGNGDLDIAAWLPSLHAEGGPAPWEIMPGTAGFAAAISGYMAARAGLPAPEGAPRVRDVQLQQLRTALPWAVKELALPPPEGLVH